MDLADLMRNTGLMPTQKKVFEGMIQQYVEAMKNEEWDWQRTANDPLAPMIRDTDGNILAGHHRFIAAEVAGIQIPAELVKVMAGTGARVPRSWSEVKVVSGVR